MNTTPAAAPCPFTFPAAAAARAERIAGATRLSDVRPQRTRWLWPGRIPLGRVTLLVSDPGMGKSLLALDVAARVSRGAPWPDVNDGTTNVSSFDIGHSSYHAPSSVLLLTAEDDLADTVRPRLEALGADCSKILAINTWGSLSETASFKSRSDVSTCVPREFALNRDLARLAPLLSTIPDCRLLIVDPISAFLGGANDHANAKVQALLAALAALARERDLAVVILSHLRKKRGAAIHRTMGSLAYVSAARAAWVITMDPADPEKHLFLPIKNNLAPDVAGLAYTIQSSPDRRAPTIRWSPEAVTLAADVLVGNGRGAGRPDDERQYAMNWLQERLAERPRPPHDLRQEADVHGISYGTLRRAFRALGGQVERKGVAPFNRWVWKLPGTAAQNTGEEFCAADGLPDDLAELLKEWST